MGAEEEFFKGCDDVAKAAAGEIENTYSLLCCSQPDNINTRNHTLTNQLFLCLVRDREFEKGTGGGFAVHGLKI